MDLGLTSFDFAALAILGLSGVMAFARGLIREVFSVIAFIAAGIAAFALYRAATPLVEQYTPLSNLWAPLAAGLLIFLVVFITITLVTSTLAKSAHQSTEIGSFDRAAGLAFGVLRGILFVALGVLLVRQGPGTAAPPRDPTQCRAAFDELRASVFCARTYPIYGGTASGLEVVLQPLAAWVRDTIEPRQKGESATIPPASETAAPAPENPPLEKN